MPRSFGEILDLATRGRDAFLSEVGALLDEVDAFGQLVLDLPPGLAPRLLAAVAWSVAAAGLVGAWTVSALP